MRQMLWLEHLISQERGGNPRDTVEEREKQLKETYRRPLREKVKSLRIGRATRSPDWREIDKKVIEVSLAFRLSPFAFSSNNGPRALCRCTSALRA